MSDFVPKIRRELVKELHDNRGYNQKEIAKILGISQPRVSQYLSVEKKQIRNMSTQQFQLLEDQLEPIVSQTVKNIVKTLDNGKKTAETIPIICYSCRELRMGSALCTLHRYDYSDLNDVIDNEKNCDLCLKWPKVQSTLTEPEESLGSRLNTLKTLETISSLLILKLTFPDFIPEIGAQLCLISVSTNKNSLQDVAGFPGRIIQVQGRAKIVSRPEFNASKTNGKFLLDVRNLNSKIASVLSIKNLNDREFENKLVQKGYLIIETESIDIVGFENQITEKNFANTSKIAILDTGSSGYESISYLFVENIVDLIDVFD